MMGVATTGSSVGAVFFPIALNKLIPVVGFPWVRVFFLPSEASYDNIAPGGPYSWFYLPRFGYTNDSRHQSPSTTTTIRGMEEYRRFWRPSGYTIRVVCAGGGNDRILL